MTKEFWEWISVVAFIVIILNCLKAGLFYLFAERHAILQDVAQVVCIDAFISGIILWCVVEFADWQADRKEKKTEGKA